jgi:alanyl-tRNA synthetase
VSKRQRGESVPAGPAPEDGAQAGADRERAYYTDAYTTEFEAQVEKAWRDETGRTRVVLARTFFYPTSGGQMHDRGTLGSGEVVDVHEAGGRIVHVVENLPPPARGARLAASIDDVRRREHRQQHTGQHILSRVIEDRLGLSTQSSRLGETGNTLDVATGRLRLEALDAIEEEANALLGEGRPVHIRFVPEEQASSAELRKIPEREGALRVIEIAGHDRSACGGTHVRNTAEIGMIAITRLEKIQGGQRIHFLCGDRALRYRRARDRLVSRLQRALTTGDADLAATVEALRQDVKSSHKRIARLERELLLTRAGSWMERAEVLDHASGPIRFVREILSADLAGAASAVLQDLIQRPGRLVLLLIAGEGRTQVLLGRSADVEVDCASLLQSTLQPRGGKGGGQAHHARGSLPGDDLEEVGAAIHEAVLGGRQSS